LINADGRGGGWGLVAARLVKAGLVAARLVKAGLVAAGVVKTGLVAAGVAGVAAGPRPWG
jgi:hypothetical protein